MNHFLESNAAPIKIFVLFLAWTVCSVKSHRQSKNFVDELRVKDEVDEFRSDLTLYWDLR